MQNLELSPPIGMPLATTTNCDQILHGTMGTHTHKDVTGSPPPAVTAEACIAKGKQDKTPRNPNNQDSRPLGASPSMRPTEVIGSSGSRLRGKLISVYSIGFLLPGLEKEVRDRQEKEM